MISAVKQVEEVKLDKAEMAYFFRYLVDGRHSVAWFKLEEDARKENDRLRGAIERRIRLLAPKHSP